MLLSYAFIGLLMLLAVGFAVAPLVVVAIVAPRKRAMDKDEAYECGLLMRGDGWVRFRVQYYVYALLFVVFDLEAVFLIPWASSYLGLRAAGLGPLVLLEMVVFLVMLAVALAYAWANGDLEWR